MSSLKLYVRIKVHQLKSRSARENVFSKFTILKMDIGIPGSAQDDLLGS